MWMFLAGAVTAVVLGALALVWFTIKTYNVQ